INPGTGKLRSGWRALFFGAIVTSPVLLMPGFFRGEQSQSAADFEVGLGMAVVYIILIGWLVSVSWICLRFFESLRLATLGLALHFGWWRDVLKGFLLSAGMIVAVVGLQMIGGGTRIRVNPVLLEEPGSVIADLIVALLLLVVAGAFEELTYRGYASETLVRDMQAILPIAIFSVLFGFGHWYNPSRTFFSTTNTVLAGIWLSVAYLKTRNLWFPIALHFGWNWMMGAFFGLPVSGLEIPKRPLLLSTSGEPVWLTGGDYGCEGGAATTVIFLLSTVILWRARWLNVSPETAPRPIGESHENREESIRLEL